MKYITIQKVVRKSSFGNPAKLEDITLEDAENVDKSKLYFALKISIFEIYIKYSFIQIGDNVIHLDESGNFDTASDIFFQLSEKYKSEEKFEIEFGEVIFTETNICLKTNSAMDESFHYTIELNVDEKEKIYLSNYFAEVNDEMKKILSLF